MLLHKSLFLSQIHAKTATQSIITLAMLLHEQLGSMMYLLGFGGTKVKNGNIISRKPALLKSTLI